MMRRRASVSAIAAGAAILLASCGSSDPAVLSLVGTSDNAARGSVAASGSAEMAADAKMGIYWNVEYEVSGELPDLGDSARAWRLEKTSAKSAVAKFKKMAAALGVEGEVLADKNDKASYTIGADVASGTGLWLFVGETESYWSYNNVSSSAIAMPESCSVSSDGTKSCSGSSAAPAPPKNLPSKSEALAAVRDAMVASGETLDDYALTATGDEWAIHVQATLKLGGVATSYAWWFSFGEDGALSGANGQFIQPAKADKYPIIDPAKAIDRLTMQPLGMSGAVARSGVAVDTAAAESDQSTAASPPEQQTTIVKVDGARLTLMTAYLADSHTVLLPAYTYSNEDGDVGSVYAVADKYLDWGTNEPSDDSVSPPASDPSDSVSGGSGADSGSGGAVEPAVPPVDEVGSSAVDAKSNADSLIGLAEAEALKLAESNGWTVRVASRDGEDMMLTADYLPERMNLVIVGGIVTDVSLG